ncbi:hypothetical protein CAPTEDRAFT_134662, partial [Capitella teleta]
DSQELKQFIHKIGPLMIQELVRNSRSHAFEGYDVNWGEDTNTVTDIHTLCHAEFAESVIVTNLSWNSTGAVVAASYGRFDHEDWCMHKSGLCTWNLDRRNLDADKPDSVIDVSSCLMCIAYHPQKPAWIAGGTFNGEVIVWDTSQTEETLVASSGIGDDSHRDPVAKLTWIPDPESKGKKFHIVSVSSDGRILTWKVHASKQKLKLINGFVLLTDSLPRHLRVRSRGNQEMGVTCISFSKEDETKFMIGSDCGGIFQCSTSVRGNPANESNCSVELRSPVTMTFNPHSGPVYGIECSPFHHQMMLTSASDASVRLYSLLRAQPLITIDPGAGYVYAAKWSPVRPLLFAVVTEGGHLYFYDLQQMNAVPILKLEVAKRPIYSLQFNAKERSLLATGDGAGKIRVWRLNEELVKPGAKEMDSLTSLASSALQ